MDLIQPNGQPHFGHFDVVPKTIDINRYEYKSLDGTVLTGWRKRLQYTKFKCCYIQHEHYSVGLAIADIAWAGHSFFYIYDHQTQEIFEWDAINFLSRRTNLDEQPLFNQSYFQKSPYELQIEHAHGVRYIQLTKFGEIIFSARIFCAGIQPLSLCSPIGPNGWIYTQKLMTLNCEGFFQNKYGKIIQFNDRSFATLDDTCCFSHDKNVFTWLSCNFWDQQKNRIGLNLAGRQDHQYTENCIWINCKLYPLDHVVFTQQADDVWSIQSQDGRVDLTVKTTWRRCENLNLRLTGNQFSQWQAKISGTITYEEQDIVLLDEYGLLEQHSKKKSYKDA